MRLYISLKLFNFLISSTRWDVMGRNIGIS